MLKCPKLLCMDGAGGNKLGRRKVLRSMVGIIDMVGKSFKINRSMVGMIDMVGKSYKNKEKHGWNKRNGGKKCL